MERNVPAKRGRERRFESAAVQILEVVMNPEGGADAFEFEIDFGTTAAEGAVFIEVVFVADIEIEAEFREFLEVEFAADENPETINFIFIVDQVAIQVETADAALDAAVEFAVFPDDGSIHEFDFADIKVCFLLEACTIADPEIHSAIEEVPLDAEAILIPGAAGNTVEELTGPHSLITDADFPVALLVGSRCRRAKKQRRHHGGGDKCQFVFEFHKASVHAIKKNSH